MASHDETVTVMVGGKSHSQWTAYSIDSDLLIPADAWDVRLTKPAGKMPDNIQRGASVQVKVGGETVLSGFVDRVKRRTGKDGKSLAISGRDMASVLRDCSAPIFTAKQVTLAEVAATIVKPLGITKIRIQSATSPTQWDKISVEPGESAWDALVHAAEGEGLWPWFEPDGTLVIGGPDYNAPPVASLVLRDDGRGNNVEWFDEDLSNSERYSEVTVLGQAHGTSHGAAAAAIKTTVKDTSVPTYRPKIFVDHDAPNLAAVQSRAKKIISDSALAAHTLQASVKGHRTADGALWKPGQRVHIVWEEYGVDAIYFLMGRRLTGGASGNRTSLKLKEDGVWIPDAHPHSGRKHRHGGKHEKPGFIVTDATINANIMK
ncbi:bacteriophage Mu P family protein [Pandoraea anapnoica]|uniref:Bacteriophage Mu P family protein n=1 Tax=Pandoraea anapnoica TaxID=2508301 RepID=A0A5E5AU09_9BURK|nr:phage tail protein [Pandoraea anapnoica]VVE76342.1 bacteriophage Mu P family protein [Pandoraea anapnoica]